MSNMNKGKPDTCSNLAWHRRPQTVATHEDEHLIQKSLRALTTTHDPLEKLRLLCLSRGAAGIMGLARVFRRMDNNGRKQLNREEFFHGLKETGLELDKESAEHLFNKFDVNNTGTISLDDFIEELRPPMSDSRRAIVEQAFRKLDKTGDGMLTVADIKGVYNVNSDTRYISGEDTADVIMNKFIANFEAEGVVEGKVTMEEFLNYYSGLSLSVDSDCCFDLMIRQSYKL